MRQREPRKEDPKHLACLRQLPCACCLSNIETEAAHIRFGCLEVGKPQTGMQTKPDDMYAVPLCGSCHRAQHAAGDEESWWKNSVDRDPIRLALRLYAATGDVDTAERIIRLN